MNRRVYRPLIVPPGPAYNPRHGSEELEFTGFLRSMVILEEEDFEPHVTGVLDAFGNMIVAHFGTDKQGFIGFLCPSWAEDLFAPDEEEGENADADPR